MAPNSSNHFAPDPKPPKFGEKILAFILHQDGKEVILGNFEEEYFLIARKFGVKRARRWYWSMIIKSMPSLLFLTYNKSIRSRTMIRNKALVFLGIVLVLPAFLLVLGGVAQSAFGITKINDGLNFNLLFFNPVVVVGGLILSFVLNLLPVIRISYQDGILMSRLTVRDSLLNVGLISIIGLLSVTIFIYLLVENFHLFHFLF